MGDVKSPFTSFQAGMAVAVCGGVLAVGWQHHWSTNEIHWAGLFVAGCCCAWLVLQFVRRLRLRRRAGCVPLRVAPGGRLNMMLVQSRKHPEWWIFPAGGVEPGERVEEAAIRETREEAGLVGRLGRIICDVSDGKSQTRIYALHVEAELEQWDEGDWRQRKWFDVGVPGSSSCDEAVQRLYMLLSPKAQHQRIMQACARMAPELRSEAEKCEVAVRKRHLVGGPSSSARQRAPLSESGASTS